MDFIQADAPGSLEAAARVLNAGGVAVIPTDTVYGLAAHPSFPAAVARLYTIKGRAAAKPIALLAADAAAVRDFGYEVPPALAAQVTAADLLARSVGEKVASADDARRMFSLAVPLAGKSEGVFVLPLDADRCAIAAPILVSLGTEATAVVQAKDIFTEALKAGAEKIIVAHNHPSGDLTPSKADVAATRELKDLASRLGIEFLDHLIVGPTNPASDAGFVSLAEME